MQADHEIIGSLYRQIGVKVDWRPGAGARGPAMRKSFLSMDILRTQRMAPLAETTAFGRALLRRCHDCGRPIGARDAFCPFCGAKQPRESIAAA